VEGKEGKIEVGKTLNCRSNILIGQPLKSSGFVEQKLPGETAEDGSV
jgi:hypothetical protein